MNGPMGGNGGNGGGPPGPPGGGSGSGRPPVGGSGSGRPPVGGSGSGSGRPPVGGSGSGSGSGRPPIGGSGSGSSGSGSGNSTGGTGSSDDCICGLAQRATRIVGGQEVEVNEWPWQAGMVWSGSSSVFCGATVWTEQMQLRFRCSLPSTTTGTVMTQCEWIYRKSSCTPATTAAPLIKTSLSSRWLQRSTGPRIQTSAQLVCRTLQLETMISGCPLSQVGEQHPPVDPSAMSSSRLTSR